MSHALVFLPLESNEKKILETCFILDFEKYETYPKSHIYRYDDGKIKYKCAILLVSGK